MPALSKWAKRVPPASYKPRSKRLPSKREKTLWKNGSRLGNSTAVPARRMTTRGWKLLFFCTRRGRGFGSPGTEGWEGLNGISHTALSACPPRQAFPSRTVRSTRPVSTDSSARADRQQLTTRITQPKQRSSIEFEPALQPKTECPSPSSLDWRCDCCLRAHPPPNGDIRRRKADLSGAAQ